ncbi:acetate--CoA ligase [Thelephora terrestris]|uniref:Acetyl-coenzyme A synthetase n=2 Tax=Thelephora terrestris TaxID=56493 RepID=A0A9P6HT48_9AGAM|nr:acetate--CoA ligase [Thelephora terrestris]
MADSQHQSIPTHPIAPRVKEHQKKPHVGPDILGYRDHHGKTVGEGSDEWWAQRLYWDRPFKTVRSGSFENGDIVWFPEGGLDASYNCVDRWAYTHPSKLLREVCSVANILKAMGIKKGYTVSVYMPMTWHAVATFLACARIGAIHSVGFAGFSSESLRDRIKDCKSRAIVDAALKECPEVEHVLVQRRTGNTVAWTEGRDKWWHEETLKVPNYCPPEVMSSEVPFFILYTSGSTGKPKGVVHTTAGYLLGAAVTVKYVFDVHPEDKFACMADVGWITGHTYIVYGPLLNGVTTTVFESTPVYPTPSRYWQVVEKHQITHFYTAPTAIRLLRRLGEHHTQAHDLSTVRVLGSVGEPINPEAWDWYNEHVGKRQCAIVDTWWQTETGLIMITPFPGAIETKPGSATVPFFGIEPVILDPVSGEVLEGNSVEGILCIRNPWPSIARTVWKDNNRYLDTYMRPYPGFFYTGDGAARDEHGYIWIKGRVDDVINVSGHRLSTAEIESALILHRGVAETAVIGVSDDLTGQTVYAFVTLKPEFTYNPNDEGSLAKELILQVRKVIGPFAAPKKIIIIPDLPKTRSGKIMRRIMCKISAGEGDQLGDLSTLADPSVVDAIKAKVATSS